MNQRDLHEEIRAGWEIVAAAKYRGELNRRAIVLQWSHGLDALGLLNLGVREVVGIDKRRLPHSFSILAARQPAET